MRTDVSDLSLAAVEREITTLAGHLAAATCRFLELLAAFDTGGGWRSYGLRSCSQWLSWKCGLSLSAAGEQLRVAHALEDLHAVRTAFAAGRISYSKARALTRAATPENEHALVETATACTARQLDRLCRGIARARSNEQVIAQQARASFTARWEADGTLRFCGRLTAEDGRVLLAALAAMRPDPVSDGVTDTQRDADATWAAAPTSTERPDAAARAAHSDAAALVVLAEHALALPPDPVRASPVRLVVHTTADPPAASVAAHAGPVTGGRPDPSAEGCAVAVLDAGPGIPPLPLGPDTRRRLACEALVEPATHPDSAPATTAAHRFASTRQRRALLARDGGCAFPGCPRRRHLHAHHLQPWSEGGATTMRNLALACSHHHRLLHEGGWQLRARPDQRFDALRPDGAVLTAGPPAHGNVRQLPSAHRATIEPDTVTGTWTGEPSTSATPSASTPECAAAVRRDRGDHLRGRRAGAAQAAGSRPVNASSRSPGSVLDETTSAAKT